MSAAIVGEALWLVTQLGLGGRFATLGLSPQIGPRPVAESKIG